MEKESAIAKWVKSNPLILLAGALTTIFGLVISTGNVIPVILKGLNLPDCFTYATVYRIPWSYFKREDELWREYPPNGGKFMFEFREFQRTRDNIDLLNITPRLDNPAWQTLMVRLPVCGGMAKIAAGIPQHWGDLAQAHRE